MEIEYLNTWNPWWATKEVPGALRGTLRSVDPLLFKALAAREIVALTGIRRSGKTTLMYQMIASLLEAHHPHQILYVNLDDDLLRKETIESLYAFYRQQKNPGAHAFVFLDEIQNVPGWEQTLKKYYDLHEKVKFVVSGSSSSLLHGELSTLLTGRNLTFTIAPLSFREFLDFSGIAYGQKTPAATHQVLHALNGYLEFGGFPEVFFKERELKRLLLRQYVDDIIYKDIVKRHHTHAAKVTELAVALLTSIASPFTIRKLRGLTGLSIGSVGEYLSYLEDAYLLLPLDHFSYSFRETSRLPKKSYALDCGMRNVVGFRISPDTGRLAENCVRAELWRRGKEAYYWKGRGEVDFVVKNRDQTLSAINVSFTDRLDERELLALQEFAREFKRTKEQLILTRSAEGSNGPVRILPLWKWLLEEAEQA